jgi:hypothetical protein
VGELRRQVNEMASSSADSANGDAQKELADLREERRVLLDRLAEAETQLKDRPASGRNEQEIGDLRRRFEMAVEDVRELKTQNAELEEQLAQGGGSSVAAPETAVGEPLDWEAQKRQLMARLEADFDEDDEEDQADRLTVEGAIRITDQVVADKEREIAELKKQLKAAANTADEATAGFGDVAVGAAAIADMLDQDDLIKQERENLKRLQDQWQEKLRKAEIDISVERAKIGRERAEMVEQLENLAAQKLSASSDEEPEKVRGRWLSRLGLKDDD